VAVLWGVAMFPLGRWTTSWQIDTTRLASALPTAHGSTPAFEA